jgi:hypothetical protein
MAMSSLVNFIREYLLATTFKNSQHEFYYTNPFRFLLTSNATTANHVWRERTLGGGYCR